jgi:transcriptional regulator with XRE-family HTH domain
VPRAKRSFKSSKQRKKVVAAFEKPAIKKTVDAKQRNSSISQVGVASLNADQRRMQAWEFRMAGYSEYDIAEALGVSQGRVSQYLTEAAAVSRERRAVLADSVIEFELDRIDQIVLAWYPRAKIDPDAADVLRKWLERSDRIRGLNIDRREISGPHGGAINVRTSELDLSKLSDQELEWLQVIVSKAGPQKVDTALLPPLEGS